MLLTFALLFGSIYLYYYYSFICRRSLPFWICCNFSLVGRQLTALICSGRILSPRVLLPCIPGDVVLYCTSC